MDIVIFPSEVQFDENNQAYVYLYGQNGVGTDAYEVTQLVDEPGITASPAVATVRNNQMTPVLLTKVSSALGRVKNGTTKKNGVPHPREEQAQAQKNQNSNSSDQTNL